MIAINTRDPASVWLRPYRIRRKSESEFLVFRNKRLRPVLCSPQYEDQLLEGSGVRLRGDQKKKEKVIFELFSLYKSNHAVHDGCRVPWLPPGRIWRRSRFANGKCFLSYDLSLNFPKCFDNFIKKLQKNRLFYIYSFSPNPKLSTHCFGFTWFIIFLNFQLFQFFPIKSSLSIISF